MLQSDGSAGVLLPRVGSVASLGEFYSIYYLLFIIIIYKYYWQGKPYLRKAISV